MRLVELRPALALCVVLASAVPAAANVSFDVTEEEDAVDSVANPQAITLADVDGDTFEDVIVVELDDTVTVFNNDGTGGFDDSSNYFTIGEAPVAVATGQFNADTFVDIVTVNSVSGTVSILLNDEEGQGIFDDEDPRQFVVSPAPRAVAVADFNNDTELDLAVLSAGFIYFLQGNGDGTFSAFNPATQATRGTDSFTIAAGLLDSGNTNIDLAVSNRGGSVSIFLGNGDGTFTFNGSALPGSAPAGFVIADANQDQNNDLIVTDEDGVTTTEMSLMLNDGDAVFPQATTFTGPEQPFAITSLDVEPDGKVDIAIVSMMNMDQGIFLLCQISDECVDPVGGPLEAGIWRAAIGGTIPGCSDNGQVAIVAGKLDDDDKDDIVALKINEDGDFTTLCIALNKSTVGNTPVPTTPTGGPSPTPSGPTSTPTITPTRTPTPTATEIPTIGLGVCNTKGNSEFPTFGRPVALATGDFDRDGVQDVAVADATGNQVLVLLETFGASDPNMPCSAVNVRQVVEIAVDAPEAIVASDLDRDGSTDLAVIGSEGLYAFYGNGSGTFMAAGSNPLAAGVDPSDIALADLNRDFTPDLIVTDSGSTNVSIFFGTRQRTFNSRCAMPVQGRTNAAVSTDLNNDGRNDFAVASPQSRNIGVFLQVANAALACSNMAASFQGQTTLNLPGDPVGLLAGTFGSGDTIPDLVVAMTKQASNGTVLLFEGRVAGSGVTYQQGTENAVPTPTPNGNVSVPSAIGSGDIERDGRRDLLITDRGNDTLAEFRGQQSGGLGVPLVPVGVMGDGPMDLAIVDLDGDARDDVVIANADDGSLSYMLSEQRMNTPTPTNTPIPTATTPAPPVGTATSTPTITPTATRSRRPSVTPTPVPTNTQRGVVTLSGNGCAIDQDSNGPGSLLLTGFVLAALVMRRRAVDRWRG